MTQRSIWFLIVLVVLGVSAFWLAPRAIDQSRATLIRSSAPSTEAVVPSPGIANLDIRESGLESEGTLTDAQRTALAEQAEQFFRAQTGASLEEYISLIESWEGRLKVDRSSQDFQQMQDWWQGQSQASTTATYDAAGIAVERVELEDTPSGSQAPFPPARLGGTRSMLISRFYFPRSPEKLAQAGSPIMRITIPTTVQDDRTLIVDTLFVWDESSDRWLPFRQFLEGSPGDAISLRVF